MLGRTLVNRYHIEAEISRGGMGIVYHAQDLLLHRAVAVKILSATTLKAANKARLLREAQAAARLNHSNIVAIHDAGEAEGTPFIVMELVAGETLRQHHCQTLAEVMGIARQVCAALEHAHAHGIIHRDLKPDNVLVLPPSATPVQPSPTKIKLTDFGLAYADNESPITSEDDHIVGTFTYLAPEVLQGHPASAQSDLYALGIMLYELSTGQPPFIGENLMAVIAQHLSAPVPLPSTFNSDIPPELEALIFRLLSKAPAERPASARDVGATLERLLAHRAGTTTEVETAQLSPALDLPKLLLVDDDAFNRDGVRLFLTRAGYQVFEAGDEETAWQLAQMQALAVAVVDISLPATPTAPSRPNLNSGVHLAQRLKATFPALGVVLFSAYEDRGAEILALLQAGHRGLAYKLKGSQPKALLAALQDVQAGRVVIDSEVIFNRRGQVSDLLNHLSPEERTWVEHALAHLPDLTPREREVAQRLAAAHNTEGIARALNITTKATENHISHIYDKLGLNEMRQAAPHLRQVVILAKVYMIKDFQT